MEEVAQHATRSTSSECRENRCARDQGAQTNHIGTRRSPRDESMSTMGAEIANEDAAVK
jgi:hypothetical protein